MMRFYRSMVLLLMISWVSLAGAKGEDHFAKVEITTEKLADTLYVLYGEGGNIGASVGEDGVFLIDDQFAPLTTKIMAAIKKISTAPISYVINTHWHFDHTGGNENLGRQGALIIAHDNVRRRMAEDHVIKPFGWEVKAAPPVALPVITFNDRLTFHLNGDVVHVLHHKNAHTDGDGVAHFTRANVIHTGDIWFNGLYPFIDVGSGGSIDGMIAAVEQVIAMADESSIIIPGHGPVGDRAELQAYLAMLKTLKQRVQQLIDAGKSLEEIIALKPNADDYDQSHGGGFVNPETMLSLIHASLIQ